MGAIAIKTTKDAQNQASRTTKTPFAGIKIALGTWCAKIKAPSTEIRDLDFERYARLEAKRSMYTTRRNLF
jgi:hypothetical protein